MKTVKFNQMKDGIVKHLRDRNYSNTDIEYKLDELLFDMGGHASSRQGSRWS